MELMHAYANAEEEQGSNAQARVSTKALEETLALENALLMAYMGLNGNKACVEFIREFRRKSPDCFIAVLTCDCNLEEKNKRLAPVVAEGIVDQVIVSDNCGGIEDMGDILRSLIEQWPTTL